MCAKVFSCVCSSHDFCASAHSLEGTLIAAIFSEAHSFCLPVVISTETSQPLKTVVRFCYLLKIL